MVQVPSHSLSVKAPVRVAIEISSLKYPPMLEGMASRM